MNNNYIAVEFWRITVLTLFITLLGGMISHQWLISLAFALVVYIVWFNYKLFQLHRWLKNGAKAKNVPDNNGLWGSITQQILIMQKKSTKRKKRMGMLLKRSQGIITGLPYAAVVLNQYNEIDWANKISANYLNIDLKTDRGQRIDNLIRLPEFRKMLTQVSPKEIECSLPHSATQKLALQLVPVQKDLKLLIAQDITEREAILQMRKNFIANASHELRTPLTVIAGYLEIMQEQDDFPESLQTALVSATDQSIRMQRIIEDLLILSRLENSTLDDATCTIINMPSVLQSICQDEISLITNNTHTLKTDIDPSLKIHGSEAEIISVCINLVHNSVRHTQDGTQITVEWRKDQSGKPSLTIKDTGQGIPPEHILHLTERFYRVDKGRSRDKGGTGLGLAIVQHIIQRHGGWLEIQSVVGKGSTFRVCLPSERIVKADSSVLH